MSGDEHGDTQHDDGEETVSGRDRENESEPTEAGHSTADTHVERNQEDEPPG